ncbi:Flagellar hook-length control protein [Gilliamella apicola SCGC AB-598-I20]|nr:Flagellar hook-length control protein [Gilliamella apicola SCGC AB-598-I20]
MNINKLSDIPLISSQPLEFNDSELSVIEDDFFRQLLQFTEKQQDLSDNKKLINLNSLKEKLNREEDSNNSDELFMLFASPLNLQAEQESTMAITNRQTIEQIDENKPLLKGNTKANDSLLDAKLSNNVKQPTSIDQKAAEILTSINNSEQFINKANNQHKTSKNINLVESAKIDKTLQNNNLTNTQSSNNFNNLQQTIANNIVDNKIVNSNQEPVLLAAGNSQNLLSTSTPIAEKQLFDSNSANTNQEPTLVTAGSSQNQLSSSTPITEKQLFDNNSANNNQESVLAAAGNGQTPLSTATMVNNTNQDPALITAENSKISATIVDNNIAKNNQGSALVTTENNQNLLSTSASLFESQSTDSKIANTSQEPDGQNLLSTSSSIFENQVIASKIANTNQEPELVTAVNGQNLLSTSTPLVEKQTTLDLNLPMPMDVAKWQTALNEKISLICRQGIQNAEIKLHPEELGSLHIKLALIDDKMNLHMAVTHNMVKSVLESALPQLRTSLEEHGITLQQTDISDSSMMNDSKQSSPYKQEQQSKTEQLLNEKNQSLPKPEHRSNVTQSGLSIFA